MTQPSKTQQPLDAEQDQIKKPEESILPIYASEHHLHGRDSGKIKEAIKDPLVQKLLWHKIITILRSEIRDEDAIKKLAELRAYANMLPELEQNQQSQMPAPRTH